MKEKKLKVAIYCRVGREEQLAVEKQESEIKKYCKQQGYEIFRGYKDNGYNANDKTRPSYNLMLEDLKQNRFDMIITSDMSRLCRSISDLEDFVNLIKKHNCNLTILNENIDTSTAIGMCCVRILTAIKDEIIRRTPTNE